MSASRLTLAQAKLAVKGSSGLPDSPTILLVSICASSDYPQG
jgi:hypothetical protein